MSEIEVKALEWRVFCSRSGNCEAKTQFGEYVIQSETDGWCLYLLNQDDAHAAYSTLEYAQAAAQSDYDARIRSALVERKAEPVAWRCKDFADGWILYDSELRARDYKVKTGCLMQPLYSTPPAAPVQPEYGYMRIVEVFDRNETAGAFLSEDGEGGFAAGVSRMADEIDRLRAALSAAPEPVTVEGGGNAVPQTLDEIIENSLRMWYFNYDPSLDHTAARIAMREIIRYVIDVARVSPASPSPVDSRDALDELEKARAEQWRLRREAEGSRDAARAAADSLRIERDALRAAIEPFAKLYAKIPEDNFWPSEEYRNLGVAAEAYALSASPSPVGDRDGLIERLVKALRPFETDWAGENGWTDNAFQRDRIVDWFGPSDFREVCSALAGYRAVLSLPEHAEDRKDNE